MESAFLILIIKQYLKKKIKLYFILKNSKIIDIYIYKKYEKKFYFIIYIQF